MAELVAQRLPETGGSNRAAQLNTIALNLLSTATPRVELRMLHAGKTLQLAIPCIKVRAIAPAQLAPAVSLYWFLTPVVGYINTARITRKQLPIVLNAFAPMTGIVVDERNYPSDFVAAQLPNYLLAQPVVYAKPTRYDLTCPGCFPWMPADTLAAVGTTASPGHVVVLVNGVSRSAPVTISRYEG